MRLEVSNSTAFITASILIDHIILSILISPEGFLPRTIKVLLEADEIPLTEVTPYIFLFSP